MSMIRRFSIAALAVVITTLAGASNASAGLIVGNLIGDDRPPFGMTVTVSNDSNIGGDEFTDLVLKLLNADGDVLVTYVRDSLSVAEEPWIAPLYTEVTTDFLTVARVDLWLTFRSERLSSSLQTCEGEGCFTNVPGSVEDGCVEVGDECVIGRTASRFIEYDAPPVSVPDAGIPLADAAASMLAIGTALRYLRVRRAAEPDATPRA